MKKIIIFSSFIIYLFIVFFINRGYSENEKQLNSTKIETSNLTSNKLDSKVYNEPLEEINSRLILENAKDSIEKYEMLLKEKNTTITQELNHMRDTYNKKLKYLN